MPIQVEVPGHGIVEFPDGMTDDQIASAIKSNMPQEQDGLIEGAENFIKGGLKSAQNISQTLMTPVNRIIDYAKGNEGGTFAQNNSTEFDQALNADKDSTSFGAGKLLGDIALTTPVGGALGGVVKAAGAPALGNAISSGGFTLGKAGGNPILNAMTRTAGGAVTGGASAGLINPEDAGTGAMIGGALPGAAKVAGTAAQRIASSLTGEVSPAVRDLAIKAQEKGIDLPLDRIADSKPLNAIASALNYVPFSGRAATESKMNSQLNQALSRTFGQDSPNVTMALRKASDELGAKFDDVLKNNTVKVDDQLLGELGEIDSIASKELGSDGYKAIKSQIDEVMEKAANGQIDGQAAYNIKRTLDRIGRRSTPEGYHALEMKRSIMEALNRSIGPEAANDFAQVRKQYGNMLALEKLAKNGAEGEISAARLANMKNINNPELQEMADIAAQFVKPREGQHSAAQRAFAGLGVGAVGGVPTLAATGVSGRIANALMNSGTLKSKLLQQPVNNHLLDALTKDDVLQAIRFTAPAISAQ